MPLFWAWRVQLPAGLDHLSPFRRVFCPWVNTWALWGALSDAAAIPAAWFVILWPRASAEDRAAQQWDFYFFSRIQQHSCLYRGVILSVLGTFIGNYWIQQHQVEIDAMLCTGLWCPLLNKIEQSIHSSLWKSLMYTLKNMYKRCHR